jgi:hypothetical protein
MTINTNESKLNLQVQVVMRVVRIMIHDAFDFWAIQLKRWHLKSEF